jgi:hypothetical protein
MRRKDAISMVGALLLTAPLFGAAPQAGDRGSIEGVVLRGASEDPASNIRVRLASLRAGAGEPVFLTTDHQGRFAFQDLAAGDYRLAFESDGYVRQILPAGEESLKLAAGQVLRNLAVRLTPAGVISGRVVDRSGQPIGNVPVHLTNETLPREVMTRSNDRGEYRFFFVAPGKYRVSAGQGSETSVDRAHGAATRFEEEFDLTFFPGVSDRDSSRVLDLRPGEELAGTDIVMGNPRPPSVRQSPVQRGMAPAGDSAPAPQTPRGQ